jgi:hypothetical protein
MKRRNGTSPTYTLFVQAMRERKQILCRYDGYAREICPVMLGHNRGEEVALVFQFGGSSRSGLPRGGQWKCLHLSKATDVSLRDGPWRADAAHRRAQTCVDDVDLDVNPESPYAPRRRL